MLWKGSTAGLGPYGASRAAKGYCRVWQASLPQELIRRQIAPHDGSLATTHEPTHGHCDRTTTDMLEQSGEQNAGWSRERGLGWSATTNDAGGSQR